jgi:hypothetical protein
VKVTLEFGQHYDRVLVDGVLLDPAPSQKLFNHSDGFAWGYGGSGPSQLALAILLESGLNDETAVRLHQQFKDDHVAQWLHDGPNSVQEIDVDVDAWLAAR